MKMPVHAAFCTAMLAACAMAIAQTPAGRPPAPDKAGTPNPTDPFVEYRASLDAAKAAYDAREITRQELGERQEKAKEKLRRSGVRSEAEKDQDRK